MNIREISKPITAKSLNESLAKKFGQKLNLEAYTIEQLEDVRNKMRTKIFNVETNESFDSVQNEAYQKSKLFLDVLNAEIAEREERNVNEAKAGYCSDDCCGEDVKAEDCTCPPSCEHCNCNAVNEGEVPPQFKKNVEKMKNKKKAKKDYKESLQDKLTNKLSEATQTCNECGKAMLTASEKKELAELEEGKRHGNSKIYKKCWKGCRKVAGVPRGEPGSCKCD